MNALESNLKKDPASILAKGLSYELYRDLRAVDAPAPAAKVYADWKEQAVQQDVRDCVNRLAHTLVCVAVGVVVAFQVHKLTYITDHKIWIRSPSGDTTIQLPLFDALRVIRKKRWRFAEVELVGSGKRRMSHGHKRKAGSTA